MDKRLLVALMAVTLTACKTENGEIPTVDATFDCTTVASPAPDLATIDTGMTPRADWSAELLALEASGEFIAPEGLYQRVSAELTGLKAIYPQLPISVRSCFGLGVILNFDDETYAEVQSGTYDAWDSLNENLRGEIKRFIDSFNSVSLSYDGLYNQNNLLAAYGELPGVTYVEPNGVYGDGDDICLAVRDDFHYYIFDEGEGDCPAGCIEHKYTGFEVDASGNIRLLGMHEKGNEEPDWFQALQDCRVFL